MNRLDGPQITSKLVTALRDVCEDNHTDAFSILMSIPPDNYAQVRRWMEDLSDMFYFVQRRTERMREQQEYEQRTAEKRAAIVRDLAEHQLEGESPA